MNSSEEKEIVIDAIEIRVLEGNAVLQINLMKNGMVVYTFPAVDTQINTADLKSNEFHTA